MAVDVGLVGLGRMGGNMRERLRRAGHTVVGFDLNPAVSDVPSIEEMVKNLPAARIVWVMLPPGKRTSDVIRDLLPRLSKGDIVIDGGNSQWTDSRRHYQLASRKGIGFVDCGVSGGVWGLDSGYALMTGGDARCIEALQPIFDALKPVGEFGWVHAGPTGAGHFSKMIHNAIEYALMQAYAEGLELLQASDVIEDVTGVFRSWRDGTVIRSWLLDLLVRAIEEDENLEHVRGYADDSGQGRWAVETAIERGVPLPAITSALFARFASRQDYSLSMRAVLAMRNHPGAAVRNDDRG